MKKQLYLLAAFFFSLVACAQQPADSFNMRLENYMRLNREANIQAIMDYVHTSLFKHVDRNSMVQSFQQFFNNAQQRISIDSTTIQSVSPVFTWHDTAYRKVNYEMSITLRVKDSAKLNDPVFISQLTHALQTGFEGSTVYFNPLNKFFGIRTSSLMIAIKDKPSAPWMFLGYQKNEAFLKALFPEEVIRHFGLL